jgi:hypothetical protein
MPRITVGTENDGPIEIVEGGPHNIGWTHPEEVNAALLEFLNAPESTVRTEEAVARRGNGVPR